MCNFVVGSREGSDSRIGIAGHARRAVPAGKRLEKMQRIRGIVLRTVKVGDSSLVVDLFTEQHGRMSFVAHVSSSGRRRSSGAAFWRPLNMVEFDAEVHGQGRLPHVRGVRLTENYADLPYQPVKQMLAMFLAEFLSRVLRGETADGPLYDYLTTSLRWLDTARESYANFHVVFLLRLSQFVGIWPNIEEQSSGRCFDLRSGTFVSAPPMHRDFLSPDEARLLPLLMRMNYATMHLFRFTREQRRRVLQVLLDFYRLHLPLVGELRSVDVLRDTLD